YSRCASRATTRRSGRSSSAAIAVMSASTDTRSIPTTRSTARADLVRGRQQLANILERGGVAQRLVASACQAEGRGRPPALASSAQSRRQQSQQVHSLP